jgi:hypothetical protein
MVAAAPCGGHTLPAPLGIHMEAGLGPTTQVPAIHGFLLTLGVGLPTTTAAGLSARASDGDGARVAPGWDWPTTRITLPQTRLPLALVLALTHCARILRTFHRQSLVRPPSFLSIRTPSRGRAWVSTTTSYSAAIPPEWESLAVAWATSTVSPVRRPSTAWRRRLSIPMLSALWGRVVKREWVTEEWATAECPPAARRTEPIGPQAHKVHLREAGAVAPTPPCRRQAVAGAEEDASAPSTEKRVSHISHAIPRDVGYANFNLPTSILNKSKPLTT